MIGWMAAALGALLWMALWIALQSGSFAGFGIGIFVLFPSLFALQLLLAHLVLQPSNVANRSSTDSDSMGSEPAANAFAADNATR